MKQVIRLTESDLHKIIKESVKRILKEDTTFDNHIAGEIFDDLIQKGIYRRLPPEKLKKHIMNSYGLKTSEEAMADDIVDKVVKYKLHQQEMYGLTEANWSNALRDPGDYDPFDDEEEDDWDSDPLDNWKRNKEDGLI